MQITGKKRYEMQYVIASVAFVMLIYCAICAICMYKLQTLLALVCGACVLLLLGFALTEAVPENIRFNRLCDELEAATLLYVTQRTHKGKLRVRVWCDGFNRELPGISRVYNKDVVTPIVDLDEGVLYIPYTVNIKMGEDEHEKNEKYRFTRKESKS